MRAHDYCQGKYASVEVAFLRVEKNRSPEIHVNLQIFHTSL